MSKRLASVLLLTTLLVGCGGSNPFKEDVEPTPEPELPVDPTLPEELPGTVTPSAATAISRYEARDEDNGNGYAEDITRNADGTYTVDNLAFDGDNTYRPVARAPITAAGYENYEADDIVLDPISGNPIDQFDYRLLAGKTGNSEFAIVRTGEYKGYGFGGFVLSRSGGVTLPTGGQAKYEGNYAAMQDFDGAGGLRYVTGKTTIAFDYGDFNNSGANYGYISDRQVFNSDGVNITPTVLAAIDAKYDENGIAAAPVELPVLHFYVGPNTMDANGEIRGKLESTVTDYNGERPTPVKYEEGSYYGIVSGNNGTEIVGIIVVESERPDMDGVTQRETGGFIVYR